jgi:hypothetical protein
VRSSDHSIETPRPAAQTGATWLGSTDSLAFVASDRRSIRRIESADPGVDVELFDISAQPGLSEGW